MPEYVALLRGVNVGGRRILKMADLRTCLGDSGLTDVETYIQTGNVRFKTSMRSRPKVEAHVEDTLRSHCGFDVTTIVLTPAELSKVYADAMAMDSPFGGEPRRYVTFLKGEPPAEAIGLVDGWNYEGERAKVRGRAVHIWLTMPTHQAKISNARLERSLGPGTTRDLKVVTKLAQMWGS